MEAFPRCRRDGSTVGGTSTEGLAVRGTGNPPKGSLVNRTGRELETSGARSGLGSSTEGSSGPTGKLIRRSNPAALRTAKPRARLKSSRSAGPVTLPKAQSLPNDSSESGSRNPPEGSSVGGTGKQTDIGRQEWAGRRVNQVNASSAIRVDYRRHHQDTR